MVEKALFNRFMIIFKLRKQISVSFHKRLCTYI